MRRTLRGVIMAFMILLVAAIAVTIYAAEFGPFLFDKKMAKELKLSADQSAALEKVRLDSADKRIDLGAKIKKLELHLRAETNKDEPDEGKVMEFVDEIGKAKTEIRKIRIGNMLAAKKILTPEQREKARNMADELAELKKQEQKAGGCMCPMMKNMMGGNMMGGMMGNMMGGGGMAGPGMMQGMPEKSANTGMGMMGERVP